MRMFVRACVPARHSSLHKRLGARAFRECEHVEVAHFYFPPQTPADFYLTYVRVAKFRDITRVVFCGHVVQAAPLLQAVSIVSLHEIVTSRIRFGNVSHILSHSGFERPAPTALNFTTSLDTAARHRV